MNMNKGALSLWGRHSNVLRHHFKLKNTFLQDNSYRNTHISFNIQLSELDFDSNLKRKIN